MLEFLAQPWVLVLNAVLYGGTMKVADLLNEHGLKLFKGADLLFGVLWGLFGLLLVLGDQVVAQLLLAAMLSYLLRNRLDFPNHRLAAVLIIGTFVLTTAPLLAVLLPFFLIFYGFGSLKDYVDDRLKLKNWLFFVTESAWHYPVPAFVYSLVTGRWIVFWAMLAWVAAYDLTKFIAARHGYR
ncbi:hypothetical protein HY374_04270 [Candidatus Berkelbacteria bacterium]|nr:hypothetical protein [Candidatus Berkelbacteria bacterium]